MEIKALNVFKRTCQREEVNRVFHKLKKRKKMSGIKRKKGSESDTDDNATSADVKEEDGMDSMPSSRSAGRVRKKSAKVLEMEEFEEAEKKQYKKPDSSKKQVLTVQTPAKKIKIKSEDAETVLPEIETKSTEVEHEEAVVSNPVTPPSKKSNKSSVIKLLLSSPAVPTTPAVSTKNLTKSKQVEVKKEPESQGVTASTKKAIKSKVKIKDMTSPTRTIPPDTPVQIDVKPTIPLTPDSLTPLTPHSKIYTMSEIASISPAPAQDGSLKMKLILSPKQESTFPEFNMPEATPVVKSTKKVKKKKDEQSIENTAVPFTTSCKSPSEAMPNLAALVNATATNESVQKKKTVKLKKSKKELDFEFETLKDTFDPHDVDEEPQLVIADPSHEVEKKKKVGNKLKKKAKSAQNDNGESTMTQGGDIATLSAGGDKQVFKKKRKLKAEYRKKPKIKKNKRPPTAYTLWCNAHRHEVLKENPKMDFSQMSRRLGVIWQGLSKKEKMAWKRKAKKLAGKGSTLISTGKMKASTSTQPAQLVQQQALNIVTTPTLHTSSGLKSPNSQSVDRNRKQVVDDSLAVAFQRGLGTDPVDVAAHLKLMGESLCNIGMRLQETKGHMAVQGGLSVLLDSLICACGPLMCLTQQLYELNGCDRNTHSKTLDNIAYIMPGL